MPTAKLHLLTDARLKTLTPKTKDYALSDGGGLYVFIRAYGAKEWLLRYTSPITGKRRKDSLGSYPDISLQDARRTAAAKRAQLAQQLDPLFEKEKQHRQQAKEYDILKEKHRLTVESVFSLWKKEELQNRHDGGTDIHRAFQKDVFPVIGSKPISEITRQDIRDVLDRPLSRGSRRMANRLLSDIKQFFGYAQDEELTDNDPTRRMFKSRVGGVEKPRDRTLSETERQMLAEKLPSSGLPTPYQHAIWLMLATGCRVDEISKAEWMHVDFKSRRLTIPAEHAKNGKRHEIHLSDFALRHLRILEAGRHAAWLFPNRTGDGPIHRQTISKQIADRQRAKKIRGRAKHCDSLILVGPRWTPHDLRRTAATLMQEQGIMPHIIKKCMNQRFEDKMMETYQRADLAVMQQDAFDRLGKALSLLNKPLIRSAA